MKIALFGANGTIGQRILQEALAHRHQVTTVLRETSHFASLGNNVTATVGDVTDPASIAEAVKGHDAVISAVGPKLPDGDPQIVVSAAHALLDGLARAGVKRLLVVGGAGSLEVAPGVQMVDSPDFPTAWKPVALAHRDALEVYRNAQTNIDWTYISPAAMIAPGQRTGRFRTGGDQLLTDKNGESHISAEDYAAALLEELENPSHTRRRMTVAY